MALARNKSSVYCCPEDREGMVIVVTLSVTTSDRSGKTIWQSAVPFLRGPMYELAEQNQNELAVRDALSTREKSRCLDDADSWAVANVTKIIMSFFEDWPCRFRRARGKCIIIRSIAFSSIHPSLDTRSCPQLDLSDTSLLYLLLHLFFRTYSNLPFEQHDGLPLPLRVVIGGQLENQRRA